MNSLEQLPTTTTTTKPDRFSIRTRQGIKYRFDNETGLFENPATGKWVRNPINRTTSTETTLRYYQHPDVDHILAQFTQDPYMIQCIGYWLKCILIKQKVRTYYGKYHSTRKNAKLKMTWLSHEFSKRILGESKYQEIINKLVEIGLLEKVVKRAYHRRYNIYKFVNPEHLNDCCLLPITFKKLENKILNYRRWLKPQYAPLDQRVIDHVINTGWNITITQDQLIRIWIARYETKYLPKHPDNPAGFEEYKNGWQNVWQIISHWNESDEFDKRDFFTVDESGNRLHHVFTYLPSEIRAYVRNRQGKDLNFTQYDLANSQPALVANMLVAEHGFAYMFNFWDKDFISLVCRQGIYEDLAKKMGCSRDLAKTEMLHLLYSWPESKAGKQFQIYYPEIANVIGKLKTREMDETGRYIPFNRRHAEFPKKMQRMESKIFREVWKTLLSNGHEFLPIHDAVYIADLKPVQKNILEDLIFSILRESILIPIKIKREEVLRKA